jgi:hypothetical protein
LILVFHAAKLRLFFAQLLANSRKMSTFAAETSGRF